MPRIPFPSLTLCLGLSLAVCAGVDGCNHIGPHDTPPASQAETASREPDIIFVATPYEVVYRMLELAEVKKGDVVYDLGCGDGRIVVEAAKKYGVQAVGVDIDPQRVRESLANVKAAGVENLVTIRQADIFTLDLTQASVIALYLTPSLNSQLMPQLEKMKPGSRIVSHNFEMPGAKPLSVETITVRVNGAEHQHKIYKWVIPWEKEGD